MASIAKRGSTFRIMVSLGYGMDGKQIRKTTTFTPPENVTENKARKLAEAFAHDYENHCRGITNLNENMRFHELADWYFREIAPNTIKPVTIEYRKSQFERYVMDDLGHLKLKDISTARLDEFFNKVRKEGALTRYYKLINPDIIPLGTRGKIAKLADLSLPALRHACRGGGIRELTANKIAAALNKTVKDLFTVSAGKELSSGTVNGLRTDMSAVFTMAVKKGLIAKNPVINSTPQKTEDEIREFLDDEQCRNIIAIFESQEDVQLKVAVITLIYTGLRVGELLALRWGDINFQEGIIFITKTLSRVNKVYSLEKPKTKNSNRIIKVPQRIIDLLKEQEQWQDKQPALYGSAWVKSGQVFTGSSGGYYSRIVLNRKFKNLLKKHGITGFHIHDLRHANASLMINADISSKIIADHLGHSSTQITENVYAHLFASARAKASEAIDIALGTK